MAIEVTKARIPVVFEMGDSSDGRFKKVKIWIAHTGENLNNSYFSKETLKEMAETLPKIPIVGYIEADEDGDDDFSDHRQEIVVRSGEGVDVRYKGHAYGFIPEEPNDKFEIRDGKEWLTAEGYVWTKFKDAIDIFESDNGVKSQSMEIIGAEGEVDDIGRMIISSATFSALCILGENVPPAMTGSTVEFYSEKREQYQFELEQMMGEFEREKGELDLSKDDKVSKDNIEEINEDFEDKGEDTIVESDDEVTEGNDANAEEDKEEPEVVEEDDVTEEVEDDNLEPDVDETEVEEESEGSETEVFSIEDNVVSLNFELSHDDKRLAVYRTLDKMDDYESGIFHYIVDMFDSHVIAKQVSYDDNGYGKEKFVHLEYRTIDDSVELGEATEVFPMFLTKEEKDKVSSQREEIEELNNRLEELSEYKEQTELSAKKEILDEYSKVLGEDAVEEIEEKLSDMAVEEVEKEVAFQFFKKAQENKDKEETKVSVNNFSKTKEGKYGYLDRYFVNN